MRQASATLERIISDWRIVRAIWRLRLREAADRRGRWAEARILRKGVHARGPLDDFFDDFLPARSNWPHPAKEHRERAQREGTDAQLEVLLRYTMSIWSMPNRYAPGWLKRLRRFCSTIRHRVLDGDSNIFSPPSIAVIHKRRAPEGTELFRALCSFPIEESIIGSLVALYFRSVFESLFLPSALAFRVGRSGDAPPTHHDAITQILDWKKQFGNAGFWITEIDIENFYDSVSHSQVHQALDRTSKFATLDSRAIGVLNSYLKSYSFNLYAHNLALEKAKQKLPKAAVDVPWPSSKLRDLGLQIEEEPIGVPQGGAISCFIANLVLHGADEAVSRVVGTRKDCKYLRYCDDIIALATSRGLCESMSSAYQEATRSLQLPMHDAQLISTDFDYRKSSGAFWRMKSKAPYEWGPIDKLGVVPWCSFVGYQIRHDGMLRIRKSSLRKAMDKHRKICRDAASGVLRARAKGAQTIHNRQVLYRIRQRLRSVAVGTGLLHLGWNPSSVCWAGGFQLFRDTSNREVARQLRELDRHKCSEIHRLKRALKRMKGGSKPPKAVADRRALKYEGRPYSYFAIMKTESEEGDADPSES